MKKVPGGSGETCVGWQRLNRFSVSRSKTFWVAVIKEVLGGRDQRDYGWQ